jgi:hypothetical protein
MASSAEVMTFEVMDYTGIRIKKNFTKSGLRVSINAEFYVDFKNINLPL